MPELPEVEVLVRHLAPLLGGKSIRTVRVMDRRSIRRSSPSEFIRTLTGARFQSLHRRGKYLVFSVRTHRRNHPLIAHLGMTGRLYVNRRSSPRPKHATIVIGMGRDTLVFEDARRFGGMTLDPAPLARLGPEPLEPGFSAARLGRALSTSRQPIKVKLLDQAVVAGIGNIYASEALFLARIDPRTASRSLNRTRLRRLRAAIRRVLSAAIRFGSTLPLDFGSTVTSNDLFYYGQSAGDEAHYRERLRVYDREGQRCRRCGTPIRKIVQAGRSTFFCPCCQT